jgi:HTH-type transcriptional regulator / antitoxin HigA
MSTVLANPAEMIAHGAPRVIHNDVELEMYTDALFQLTALENPSSSEVEAIELLTLLVERYEEEHYSVPKADPVTIVRFLLEQQHLTQRDLIPQSRLWLDLHHTPSSVLMKREVGEVQSSQVAISPSAITGTQ